MNSRGLKIGLASSSVKADILELFGGKSVGTVSFDGSSGEAAHEKRNPRLAVPSCHGMRTDKHQTPIN